MQHSSTIIVDILHPIFICEIHVPPFPALRTHRSRQYDTPRKQRTLSFLPVAHIISRIIVACTGVQCILQDYIVTLNIHLPHCCQRHRSKLIQLSPPSHSSTLSSSSSSSSSRFLAALLLFPLECTYWIIFLAKAVLHFSHQFSTDVGKSATHIRTVQVASKLLSAAFFWRGKRVADEQPTYRPPFVICFKKSLWMMWFTLIRGLTKIKRTNWVMDQFDRFAAILFLTLVRSLSPSSDRIVRYRGVTSGRDDPLETLSLARRFVFWRVKFERAISIAICALQPLGRPTC